MFKEYDVVMVSSWVYTHLLIHQVVYIKYIQLFVRQSHYNKVVKKREDDGRIAMVGNVGSV